MRTNGEEGSVTDEFVDTIDLTPGESFSMEIVPQNVFAVNTLEFIGAMGQMSNAPVQADPGGELMLLLAGRVEKRPFTIGSSSPYLTIQNDTAIDQNLSERLGMITVGLRIADDIPVGHYSIFIRSSDGSRSYLPGSIVVTGSRETPLLQTLLKN